MATVHLQDAERAADHYDKHTKPVSGELVINVEGHTKMMEEVTEHTFAALDEIDEASKYLKALKAFLLHKATLDSNPQVKQKFSTPEEAERDREEARKQHQAKYAHLSDDEYNRQVTEEENRVMRIMQHGTPAERKQLNDEIRESIKRQAEEEASETAKK